MKPLLLFIMLNVVFIVSIAQTDTTKKIINALDSASAAHVAEVSNQDDKIDKAKQEMESITANIEAIQARIHALNRSNKTATQKRKQLKKDLDSLQAAIQINSDKVKDMNLLITAKDISIIERTKILDSLAGVVHISKHTADSVQKQADTAKMAIDSAQKTINNQIAMIAKQEDSLEVIAKIIMRDSVDVFGVGGDSKKNKRTKINEININVREGLITEIIVRTDFGVFRNKVRIIDMAHFEDYGGEHLSYVAKRYRNDAKSLFVFLDDVIDYDPVRSYLDIPYADFSASLVPTDKIYYIRESTSINTYFEVAAFTDIKGIGGEPNALVQFNTEAKFITNTKSLLKSIIPLHFIAFQGELAKFDNDFRGTLLNADNSINRKDLLQRSTYRVGIKANLFRIFMPPDPTFFFNDIQLNIGYNFIGSKILDTLIKTNSIIDTTARNVTQNQFFIEPKLVLSRHKNFALTLTLPFHFINLKKSSGIANSDWACWAMPGISLMYYAKRESKSRLFFRYNHWINLKDKEQAFNQMQMGFAVNLTDVLSK